jgi:hypothetical protein
MTQALTEASTTREHREGAEAKAMRLAGLIGRYSFQAQFPSRESSHLGLDLCSAYDFVRDGEALGVQP